MPRQPRLDVPGTLHHVIGRGIEGTKIFRNEGDKRDFVSRVAQLCQAGFWVVYAHGFGVKSCFLTFSGEKGDVRRITDEFVTPRYRATAPPNNQKAELQLATTPPRLRKLMPPTARPHESPLKRPPNKHHMRSNSLGSDSLDTQSPSQYTPITQ